MWKWLEDPFQSWITDSWHSWVIDSSARRYFLWWLWKHASSCGTRIMFDLLLFASVVPSGSDASLSHSILLLSFLFLSLSHSTLVFVRSKWQREWTCIWCKEWKTKEREGRSGSEEEEKRKKVKELGEPKKRGKNRKPKGDIRNIKEKRKQCFSFYLGVDMEFFILF